MAAATTQICRLWQGQGISTTSKWDDYFVRVERYLEIRDIESEELAYKREAAQELARYREELLARPGPISIKPSGNVSAYSAGDSGMVTQSKET